MSKETITLEEVAKDTMHALNRVITAKTQLEVRAELANNVYPLFLALIEAVNTRCTDTEELVSNLIAETETVIQVDDANEIEKTLNTGEALAKAVIEGNDAKALAETYIKQLSETREFLNDWVIETEDEEDDEDDDSETDEDNDEEDDE